MGSTLHNNLLFITTNLKESIPHLRVHRNDRTTQYIEFEILTHAIYCGKLKMDYRFVHRAAMQEIWFR